MKASHIGISDADPLAIVDELSSDRRVLLLGPPGVGKSTLAAGLASALQGRGRDCTCLSCDPGSPAFGVPGAVCLGQRHDQRWRCIDLEPLCSLDAARFRLPLVQAVHRLVQRAPGGVLLLDGPGVVRGVAGAELLAGLVWAAAIDLILVLTRAGRPLPLVAELCGLDIPSYRVTAAEQATACGKRARARARTALWNDYLQEAATRVIGVRELHCTGTPPPRDVPPAWVGRQVALLRGARCCGMGEVVRMEHGELTARYVGSADAGDTLLVRDAQRGDKGLLETAARFAAGAVQFAQPSGASGERVSPQALRPAVRAGTVTATLVNGVFGDPLLHVRLVHQRRSLLFDLGESGRLPARIAHQVTDVFISHAHIDHIAGFLWLLRSRIGITSDCRIFGPPGIAGNISGLVRGIHWDRIGVEGPRFEVAELHDERLVRHLIQAGQSRSQVLDDLSASGGVLRQEPSFTIRAVTLDHRTPVLAFALEPALEIKVRKERLLASGLQPGAWLRLLKRYVSRNQGDASIELPGGRSQSVAELADQLLLISRGRKLVYATDLADTLDNRARLCELAAGAHVLFCEATFCQGDAGQAGRTGHLTARACGEIATDAGVEHLIPIHFSRRYQDDPGHVYAEVEAACSATVVPPALAGWSARA